MMGKAPVLKAALVVFILALACMAAVLLAGLGTKWELWSFRTGFTILRWAAWSGLGIACLSLVACFVLGADAPRRGLAFAGIGLVCGILAFSIPASMREKARNSPRIADITTDWQNPPRFFRIVSLRRDARARNPAEYGGEAVAAQQRRAYPDIAPLVVTTPPRAAFDAALAVAVDLGWDVVSAAFGQGRIEATATTYWFGFKDDVVIRVATAGEKVRVDIRSVSRIGRNDAGANAARVRQFLRALEKKLGSRK